MIKTCWIVLGVGLLFSACTKHEVIQQDFVPMDTFSGRLLVTSPEKRFQVQIDWQGKVQQGHLRLTHGVSGRIVDVHWKNKSMLWRDNGKLSVWQPLSEAELAKMGVILPPWALARIFLGDMPSSMVTKDQQIWKGHWDHEQGMLNLTVRWAGQQRRVELVDIKHGRKAVVIFDE